MTGPERRSRREKIFTATASNLARGMKSLDLDIDYLFLLEALESGVVPADDHVDTLLGMGLVARTPTGLALTMEARVKLANLRSVMRDHGYPMA
jgi:hypothetical protein